MKVIHKIETWIVAIFVGGFFFFFVYLFHKWWVKLSLEEKKKFKHGFVRDFIITTYIVILIILISFATKHTTWIYNIIDMAR